MTTANAPSGRTRHRSTPARQGKFVALCGCLFALATLPAFAGPGLAGDSADAPAAPASSVTSALVASPLRPASSDVLFASDVNQMIAAQAALAQSAPKEEGRVQTLVKRGLALLGTPYRWGGNSPEGGFDCSGLVGYVFRTALGIDLPRVSRDMARDGEKVERTALVPGDLVFFGRRGKRVDHVGIYIGEGRFLHAPRSGRDVTVSQLDTGYWSGKFLQARRVAGLGTES
ncbi:C40 family peptidase [Luteimonas sp. SDU101]|uniref:C40 family peptidase n=1 Tax=Luteimonas sp. SDU101 TaxID=3422593 RepID=UPI003EB7AE1B